MQSENIILESFEKFKKIYSELNFSNIATKYKFEKQWTFCENNLLIFITQNNPSELEKLFFEIFQNDEMVEFRKKLYIYLCVAEVLNKKFSTACFDIFGERKDHLLKLYRDINENMSRFMSILNEELQNIFIEWINLNITKEEIEQRIILGTLPKINNKEVIIQKPKPQQKTQIQPQKPQVRELKINQTQGTSVRTLEMLNNIFNRK